MKPIYLSGPLRRLLDLARDNNISVAIIIDLPNILRHKVFRHPSRVRRLDFVRDLLDRYSNLRIVIVYSSSSLKGDEEDILFYLKGLEINYGDRLSLVDVPEGVDVDDMVIERFKNELNNGAFPLLFSHDKYSSWTESLEQENIDLEYHRILINWGHAPSTAVIITSRSIKDVIECKMPTPPSWCKELADSVRDSCEKYVAYKKILIPYSHRPRRAGKPIYRDVLIQYTLVSSNIELKGLLNNLGFPEDIEAYMTSLHNQWTGLPEIVSTTLGMLAYPDAKLLSPKEIRISRSKSRIDVIERPGMYYHVCVPMAIAYRERNNHLMLRATIYNTRLRMYISVGEPVELSDIDEAVDKTIEILKDVLSETQVYTSVEDIKREQELHGLRIIHPLEKPNRIKKLLEEPVKIKKPVIKNAVELYVKPVDRVILLPYAYIPVMFHSPKLGSVHATILFESYYPTPRLFVEGLCGWKLIHCSNCQKYALDPDITHRPDGSRICIYCLQYRSWSP